jgi:hypothetical protein
MAFLFCALLAGVCFASDSRLDRVFGQVKNNFRKNASAALVIIAFWVILDPPGEYY